MAKRILVFQHGPWEGPGKFLSNAARRRNIGLNVVKVWKQAIPDLNPFDGLIVLGGSPNVDQETMYPFLKPEKEAIRRWLANNRPYLGFCLGHQLLADAMGARVGVNFAPSIGYIKGYLTHAGRAHAAFAGLSHELLFFKWHAYAVQEPLPTHLAVLATSQDCQVEAFSVKDRPHILGLQFDNHAADPEDVEVWLDKDSKWLASLGGKACNPAKIMAEADRLAETLQQDFDHLFDNWLGFL